MQGKNRQADGRQIIWGMKYPKSHSAHNVTGENTIREYTIYACPDLSLPWAFTFSHHCRQDTSLEKSLVCPLTVFFLVHLHSVFHRPKEKSGY